MYEMKESGIKWIGQIPKHWEVRKVKYIYRIEKAKLPTQLTEDDSYLPYLTMEYIRDKNATVQYAINGTLCLEDDILVLWDGSNAGEIIYNHPCGYAPSTTAVLHCNNIYCYFGYFKYNLKSLEKDLRANINGMGIPHVNGYYLKSSFILFPPLDEQKKIADFLDKKVSEIENLIDDTKKLIEKYREYKQSIITETVTKGLNSNVEMKESGIEWIGQIPKHWEVSRLKYILDRPLQYGANEAGVLYEENLPRYIRITDITKDNHLKQDDVLSLPIGVSIPYILKHGDILFARSGATVGKTFLYIREYGKCAFAGYLIKARISAKKACYKYVYLYTLSKSYDIWKNKIFIQSTIQNIGADKYRELTISLPPLTEQEEIVKYLDDKCSQIDNIIEEKQLLLEKLEAYKKSLIYEYVTGKKQVGNE